MKLAIIGGGGFRVPLIHQALLAAGATGPRVTELALTDPDERRLAAIVAVLQRQAVGRPDAPRVSVNSTSAALTDADVVFSAIRVGGLRGRTIDERVAMAAGVLGQETVGAGGIAFGLRTVPVVTELAKLVADRAPGAWVVNFTNPAGMVTEAMAGVLGDRVIGICDSPAGLVRRASGAAGMAGSAASVDYVGLNHLGWLRGLRSDGVDLLPGLLADPARLESFEEGRLFGARWLRALGAIPNEYLHYFYYRREALQAARDGGTTRGEFLLEQQTSFFDRARQTSNPLALWLQVRDERDATYLAEARAVHGGGERDAEDIVAGGYEQVAMPLLRALAGGEPTELIVNTRNGATTDRLDPDAVIEVSCRATASGVRPLPIAPVTDHQAGLMSAVKASERAVIEAATTGAADAALRAFAVHPLVDSVTVAAQLLAGYRARLPELDYLRD